MKSVYGADIDLSQFENLRRWFMRVEDRPAVRSMYGAEALGQ